METRKVLPLALLYAADGRIKGRTRFQKLVFLANQDLSEEGIDPYDFVPYDYGPFSSDLMDTIDWLRHEGLVTVKKSRTYGGDTRYDYRLTQLGKQSFKDNLPEEGEASSEGEKRLREIYDTSVKIAERFNGVPISNLLDYVYTEYPEYAENSVLF